MIRYALFGGCLESELPFPDLPATDASAVRWAFRESASSTRPPTAVVGSAHEGACAVTLARTAHGFQLTHSCTGVYDISADGAEITWAGRGDVGATERQADLIGRVMPVVMHAEGRLCLHGSAVQIGDEAVAFLAASGAGKSTFASALLQTGARLLTDDALAVWPGSPVMAAPGVAHLRLYRDSTEAVWGDGTLHPRSDGKYVVDQLAADQLTQDAVPLAAVYLLAPARPTPRQPLVRRTHVPPAQAAVEMVRHSKIGVLLGNGEAPVVLARAAAVARTVPFFRLEIARALGRVQEAAHEVVAWHAGQPAGR